MHPDEDTELTTNETGGGVRPRRTPGDGLAATAIEGLVLDMAGGHPAPGALVQVIGADGEPVPAPGGGITVTNARGRFHLTGLPPVPAQLLVSGPGWVPDGVTLSGCIPQGARSAGLACPDRRSEERGEHGRRVVAESQFGLSSWNPLESRWRSPRSLGALGALGCSIGTAQSALRE